MTGNELLLKHYFYKSSKGIRYRVIYTVERDAGVSSLVSAKIFLTDQTNQAKLLAQIKVPDQSNLPESRCSYSLLANNHFEKPISQLQKCFHPKSSNSEGKL